MHGAEPPSIVRVGVPGFSHPIRSGSLSTDGPHNHVGLDLDGPHNHVDVGLEQI